MIVLSDDAGGPRGGAAGARRRALRAGPQRLRPGDLPPAPRRPGRALAPAPRGRAAGVGARARARARSRYAEADLEAFDDGGRRRCCCTSGASPRSSALPLLIEAYARARPGLRAPRAAGDRRRVPRRVGGRAPARGDPRGSGARDVFLAGWHGHDGAARVPARRPTSWCCPPCASSSARCSSRAWPAGCRRSRSTRSAPRRSSPTGRPAGSWSPTTSSRSPTRSCTRSTARPSAAGAASSRSREANARYAWPALAEEVASVYDAARGAGNVVGAGA